MANNLKRKHPTSLTQNTTIGVAFPLDEVNMFKGTKTETEQLKSNFLNLLLTEPGERVMEPNFGIGLKKLLFESSVDEDSLNEKINDQAKKYIPGINLLGVYSRLINHTLSIKIDYIYNLSGKPDSIKLNFLQ
tara:strand:+ start:1931 stop:2329 length:399 start_codon:yes stop_codon:yes gene_type:complete